ncbi:hypothetical protein MTP10_31775 [Nonomuraea sp. 3-1Str]|nr:hypothetical protein [Nonomuraea sp. 3-1Str]MDR8413299.1 hypothetical protein [Nonomuraea sp. 3-1Str]
MALATGPLFVAARELRQGPKPPGGLHAAQFHRERLAVQVAPLDHRQQQARLTAGVVQQTELGDAGPGRDVGE